MSEIMPEEQAVARQKRSEPRSANTAEGVETGKLMAWLVVKKAVYIPAVDVLAIDSELWNVEGITVEVYGEILSSGLVIGPLYTDGEKFYILGGVELA